jgi:hypothetical protein
VETRPTATRMCVPWNRRGRTLGDGASASAVRVMSISAARSPATHDVWPPSMALQDMTLWEQGVFQNHAGQMSGTGRLWQVCGSGRAGYTPLLMPSSNPTSASRSSVSHILWISSWWESGAWLRQRRALAHLQLRPSTDRSQERLHRGGLVSKCTVIRPEVCAKDWRATRRAALGAAQRGEPQSNTCLELLCASHIRSIGRAEDRQRRIDTRAGVTERSACWGWIWRGDREVPMHACQIEGRGRPVDGRACTGANFSCEAMGSDGQRWATPATRPCHSRS